MELWDQEVEPFAEVVESLDEAVLPDLALDVIESSIPLVAPSLRDFFPSGHVDLIGSVVAFRQAHAGDWWLDSEFGEGFLAKYDELPEVAIRPAVGPFMMALVRLFEGLTSSLSADDVMEILSSCYESVLLSHLSGLVTVEDERNSGRCVEEIDRQVRLIKSRI